MARSRDYRPITEAKKLMFGQAHEAVSIQVFRAGGWYDDKCEKRRVELIDSRGYQWISNDLVLVAWGIENRFRGGPRQVRTPSDPRAQCEGRDSNPRTP